MSVRKRTSWLLPSFLISRSIVITKEVGINISPREPAYIWQAHRPTSYSTLKLLYLMNLQDLKYWRSSLFEPQNYYMVKQSQHSCQLEKRLGRDVKYSTKNGLAIKRTMTMARFYPRFRILLTNLEKHFEKLSISQNIFPFNSMRLLEMRSWT